MTAPHVIPAAPPALLDKLQTVAAQGLLRPDASEPPPSPCVNVCRMDAQRQYCIGCLRTLDELRAWGASDADAKRAIWGHIQQRSACPTRADTAPTVSTDHVSLP